MSTPNDIAELLRRGIEAAREGKTTEARELFEQFHALLTRKDAGEAALGKLVAFRGVAEFQMRVKCATLAWHAMREALGADS